jgi:hypothetical protein
MSGNDVIVQNDKKTFVENVQKWLLYEQQLKVVSEKSKQIRESKNKTTEFLCQYMDEHGLSHNKIKISDGELKMVEKKEYTPLSFGFIELCLDNIIDDKSQVEMILSYIREQREISISKELRRFSK